MIEGQNPIGIEQEIEALERALAQKRASLQEQHIMGQIQELPQEKEILHKVIGERISEGTMPQGLPTTQVQDDGLTPSRSSGQVSIPPPVVEMPSYLSLELHEPVQNLINIAFSESLDSAIIKAKASNNPALIDAFHDVLVDELYKHLVERGKIQVLK